MRTELKTAFRPCLDPIESRALATAGLMAAAVHHPAQVAAHPASTKVEAESHHKAKAAKHPAHHPSPPVAKSPSRPTPTPAPVSSPPSNPSAPTPTPTPAPAPVYSVPTNTTTNQAWVELVNMTGQDLEYQIKIGPYANGQFLPFDIAPGEAQYRMSSLITDGRRVQADFAIQFGNGPVTPLNPGVDQQHAQGYYIFMDSNFQYYVEPFFSG